MYYNHHNQYHWYCDNFLFCYYTWTWTSCIAQEDRLVWRSRKRNIMLKGSHEYLLWVKKKWIDAKLTHCCLVTPYRGKDLGRHWFRKWLVAWRHQAITWTNVELALKFSDVHLRAISLELSQPSITKISLKFIFLRFYWNIPAANELKSVDSLYYWGPFY